MTHPRRRHLLRLVVVTASSVMRPGTAFRLLRTPTPRWRAPVAAATAAPFSTTPSPPNASPPPPPLPPPPEQPAVGREGFVNVRQTQRRHPLDEAAVEAVLRRLLEATGCAHMDVGVWLASDAKVRELNTLYRGMRKSTDILSFPFHEGLSAVDGDSLQDRMARCLSGEAAVEEEEEEEDSINDGGVGDILVVEGAISASSYADGSSASGDDEGDEEGDDSAESAESAADFFVEYDDYEGEGAGSSSFTEDDMNLGDMVVSVPYVVRAIRRDAKARAALGAEGWEADAAATRGVSGAMMRFTTIPTTTTATTANAGGDEGASESESESESESQSSLSAAAVAEEEEELQRCLEARVAQLLVHGVCHLLGHDHNDDHEHDAMAAEEERLLCVLEQSGLVPHALKS